jgi:hypothetical protein
VRAPVRVARACDQSRSLGRVEFRILRDGPPSSTAPPAGMAQRSRWMLKTRRLRRHSDDSSPVRTENIALRAEGAAIALTVTMPGHAGTAVVTSASVAPSAPTPPEAQAQRANIFRSDGQILSRSKNSDGLCSECRNARANLRHAVSHMPQCRRFSDTSHAPAFARTSKGAPSVEGDGAPLACAYAGRSVRACRPNERHA